MSEINYPSRKHENPGGTTRDINAATRVQQALKLCAQHVSWDQIASQCGYSSRGAAHNAVMRELDRCVVKNVDEMRTQELYTLNQMHSECWQLFMDKTNRGRLFAADRILAIAERRARLMGLDVKPDDTLEGVTVIRSYGVEVDRV
jgi:hypothetical protein